VTKPSPLSVQLDPGWPDDRQSTADCHPAQGLAGDPASSNIPPNRCLTPQYKVGMHVAAHVQRPGRPPAGLVGKRSAPKNAPAPKRPACVHAFVVVYIKKSVQWCCI
jgi:hypothetical protein